MNDDNNRSIYFVPKGVGNSYCVLENADYFYFNLENYDASKMYGVSYKDFDYPLKNPIVSKKDKGAPHWRDI